MSKVISLRVPYPDVERLGRVARRLNRSPGEAAAVLLREALRMSDYSHLVFRDSAVGRQAHIAGTGLAVWEIVSLVRAYRDDPSAAAEHLGISPVFVQAAMKYGANFPEEIEVAIQDNESYDEARLSRMFPHLRVIEVRQGHG